MNFMRLGLLLPSSNSTMEPELSSAAYKLPTLLSVHTARLTLKKVDSQSLLRMKGEMRTETMKLIDAGIDILLYGCTSGSLLQDKENSQNLIEQMDNLLGIAGKSTTTALCVVNSLKKLSVKRISVITPYTEEINKLEKKFLEEKGYSVESINGMGLIENSHIGEVTQRELIEFIERSEKEISKSEALFISCTNLQTFPSIHLLEEKYQIPVVSSNSASLYEVLQISQIPSSVLSGELGVLFR
ncbi:MAG: maleate cis-trans isomerase family protein [Candidatus Hodarchaeales archaeon]